MFGSVVMEFTFRMHKDRAKGVGSFEVDMFTVISRDSSEFSLRPGT